MEEKDTAARGAARREAAGETAEASPGSSLCAAAMVLGIVAVVVPLAELLLAIPTVVLAAAALTRARRQPGLRGGRGMAVAGLVLGLVALAMCVPAVIILVQII
ncbi:MAG: DUF4190 domain-containing protein [Actinomycetota bacterium]